ncbi:MAG: L-serine ammonia-lyase, partial [Actinomycetota bacterium]|nr:L-serine ammonia-lyase [Actinomycetota bacterium]
MTVSVFDLFSIGIGPSSSHTVGPMRAAQRFVAGPLGAAGLLDVARLEVNLYGSLAATGAGHGTLTAILLGLEGHEPESITTETKAGRIEEMDRTGRVRVGGLVDLDFTADDIGRHPDVMRSRHPNAMEFRAYARDGACLAAESYYSVGGGFVVTDDEPDSGDGGMAVPLPYDSAAQLLATCAATGRSIADVVAHNESATRSADDVRAGLLHIWSVMDQCVRRGVTTDGELPGGLRVRRRAKQWRDKLMLEDPLRSMAYAEDWVNVVALAVNEENAAGGRVVTAPTNGAAGIVPAVAHHARRYTPAGRADPDDVTVR